MSAMFANKEVATRHLPVAHGRDAKGESARDRHPDPRRISETRLQAAVVRERTCDELDPYADVPCTD